MSEKIKEAIKDCEELANNIMDKIDSALSSNNISFIHNNQSEIIVDNKSKDEILDIICDINDIDSTSSKLLLQVIESNEKVYIRQKFN